MKFTIESFNTSIFRPSEWLMQCDAIVHLINDLNKEHNGCISFSRCSDGNGWVFTINVYKYLTEHKLSEDECTLLTVRFLTNGRVSFEDNFSEFYKLPSEAKEYGMNYFIPYWTAVKISKKINTVVFKALQEMQDYPRLSNDEGSLEIIPVSPNANIMVHDDK